MTDYIENVYPDKKEEIDWVELRRKLRADLSVSVKEILDRFDTLSVRKVTSENKTSADTTLYSGSAGVAFGLHRYVLLLQKEKITKKVFGELYPIEKLLSAAISKNLELVEAIKSTSGSYLQSDSLGLYTLVCLRLLSWQSEDIDLDLLSYILREKIIYKAGKEIFSTGYLYSLLLLEKKVKSKLPDSPRSSKLLVTLQTTIVEVVNKLAGEYLERRQILVGQSQE